MIQRAKQINDVDGREKPRSGVRLRLKVDAGSPDRSKKPRPCGRGFPMLLLGWRLIHRPFAGAEVLEQYGTALQIFLAQAFGIVGRRP